MKKAKRRENFRKLGATNNKSPEDKEQEFLNDTVAWVIEENFLINVTANKIP